MKTATTSSSRRRAFTFAELMVTMAIGMMALAAAITGHLVGIRMFQYTSTKLGGNDDARQAIAKLTQDIRSAKLVKIGTGDATSFTACDSQSVQQGNAVQIYPTTATNNYIRYFRGGDDRLRRLVSDGAQTVVLANYITNTVVFTAEDYKGNVATNADNNRVIGLTMQFYQIEYPIVRVGPNQLYDFYQVSTRITRRTLE